jgi:hypothetical protein
MFTKNFKKYLSVLMILLVVFVRFAGPVSIFAQEADSAPTPTPTPTPTETQDQSSVQNDLTPTPTLTPTPAPTDSTTVVATNSADLSNNVNSNANTGDNTATQSGDLSGDPSPALESQPQGEPTPANSENGGGSGSSSVDTGNAASVTVAESSVNTNVINSKVIHHTLNLFISENGDLDLSDPFTIASNIVTTEESTDSTVNVLATSVENYAYLSNDVVSIANTGANTIEGSLEATINTGDAMSVVSLLNQVNFTIEGSILHIITINIFGKLTGNIILPEFSELGQCSGCGMSMNMENQATVNNNIDSQANTGENSIAYGENGSIATGDAASVVNLTNWINTNIIGLLLFNLVINVFGEWNGQFLGWGNIPAGEGLVFNYVSGNNGNGSPCCTGDISAFNSATVNNNIFSGANTGGNLASGKDASIKTGRAISIVSLANFVNTNFINSIGFFGFINIFGEWKGNVGGESAFITPTPTPTPTTSEAGETVVETADYSRENGGLLSVTNSNNVGSHVNPGDTVTFFIDVNNPGKGKAYDVKLYLYLVLDGKNVGGTVFDLGEIHPGKKSKVTTGLVLSKTAPEGFYTAVAKAVGATGEGRIEGQAQSNFIVGDLASDWQVVFTNNNDQEEEPQVLGQTNIDKGSAANTQDRILLALFAIFSSTYLIIRMLKKKEYLAELFAKGLTLKERVYSFRLFLF